MNIRDFKSPVTLIVGVLIFINLSCKKDDSKGNDQPIENNPVALDAEENLKTSFLAKWETVDGAESYKLFVSENEDFSSHVSGFNGKDVGNTDKAYVFNLNGNKNYYLRIKACFESGESNYSNVIEANTNGIDQLPNMSFENWTEFPKYRVPSPIGIWATPNKVADLLYFLDPPAVTVTRSIDAYSGQYAAKIETIFPEDFLLVTGTVATGIFEPDLQNQLESLKQGVPFTSKPIALKGYYKYLPKENDSCDIYAELTRWNSISLKRDTIAEAILIENNIAVEAWTEFHLPFTYFSAEEPDSLTIIFASSAEGDSFIGAVGSAIYVDDISLVYE